MSEHLPSPAEWSEAARAGSEAVVEGVVAASPSGPQVARIPAALLESIIDAARQGLPNEACGLLVSPRPAAEDGQPTRYVALTNAAASPYRYLIDPEEQLRVMLDLDDAGESVWAICHSHVASAPVPSATDIGLAFYPDSLYLICSLGGEMPDVRAWWIREGAAREVPLAVV